MDTIITLGELWKLKDEVRGKDAGSRVRLLQEKAPVIVASLFDLWEKKLGKVSGQSKTAEAIRYTLTPHEPLGRLVTDGRAEIGSNIVERAIRPQTITRKIVCLPAVRGRTSSGDNGHASSNLQNERRHSAWLVL